jgi:hypothetical protein
MTVPNAADEALRRLSIAARRLGTADPAESLGDLFRHSFGRPIGDATYRANTLCPGAPLPLEHSFSEVASGALRLDMEPVPGATPATRRQEATRAQRGIVQRAYGDRALKWFDERSEPWRALHGPGNERFGAWYGAGFDEAGVSETKVYYEIPDARLDVLPPNLRHAARVATACLPGLVPIFTSISCGRAQGAQRIYFYHRGDLRLLDLDPLMHRLGIGHQLPSMLTAVGLLLGGRFVLPEGSVLVAIRDTSKGLEMKLDILLPGVPDPPPQMPDLVQLHLSDRPSSQRALRHWMQAMTPDEHRQPGEMSAVSVRVTPAVGSRLVLYFSPVGYDQPSSRPRGARNGVDGRNGRHGDPYVMPEMP